jgi:RNA polymerase sigma-70 factor (ECF subfamily)
MVESEHTDATQLLQQSAGGDRASREKLMTLLYDRFRKLAANYLRHESPGHTLQPTALVHELYLKLIDQQQVDWQSRSHFLSLGSRAMRQILIDHARRRRRDKRGGQWHRITLDDNLAAAPDHEVDLMDLEAALQKLSRLDPRQAAIVELRFFGQLTVAEVADVLKISKRTIEKEWTVIRAWLRRELSGDGS